MRKGGAKTVRPCVGVCFGCFGWHTSRLGRGACHGDVAQVISALGDEKKRGKRVTITEFLTHKVRKRVDTMVEKYIKVLP